MSKSRKIIIAAAVAFAVLMMAFIFFFLSYMLNPVLSVKVTELSDQYEKVSQIGDRYFILQNSEITDADSGSTVFGSESPVKFFRNYNDSLWAFTEDETDNLICLDADGNPVSTYSIPAFTIDFLVSGSDIYTVSRIGVSRINAEENKLYGNDDYKETFKSDELTVSQVSDGTVRILKLVTGEDRINYYVTDISGGQSIESGSSYSLLSFDRSAAKFYTSDNIYEYSFDDQTFRDISTAVTGSFLPNEPLWSSADMLLTVSQETAGRVLDLQSAPETSDDMTYHKADYIYMLDPVSMGSMGGQKFRKFERVLFADSELAVTYYDHEYVVYSIPDFTEVKSIPAEVSEGNDYEFETCGDYIFIFSGFSGDYISKVKFR